MKKDDYWSIDRLLPRVSSSFSQRPCKISGVPLSELTESEAKEAFGPKFCPKNSRVIRYYRLSETSYPSNDLILQESASKGPIPFVPCEAFSPTMLSLTSAQREYFYAFCRAVKEKEKMQTSYNYIRLYLCRILRKMELFSEMPDEFFWLWEEYRSEFHLCDKLFSDTLSDFCFYKKIRPPFEKIGSIVTKNDFHLRPFLFNLYIFDYLFSSDHKLTPSEINFLLKHLTNCSFRKSKAYQMNKTYAAAAESAIHKAFVHGLFNRSDLNESLFRIQIPSEVLLTRRLFAGLPIEEIPNGKISLSYLPLLHDENIRFRCEEIVRYTENRIRAILKIKNTLSRIHISREHEAFLEGILLEFHSLAPKEESQAEEIKPLPPSEISLNIDFDFANQIEEASWQITQKLTEEYTEAGEEAVVIGEALDEKFDETYRADLKKLEHNPPSDENEFWEFAATLSETEDAFLSIALHQGNEKARKYSLSHGMFFEAVIASVNEKAQDMIGDAVLDSAGRIFPDYSDSLKEVFPEIKGE